MSSQLRKLRKLNQQGRRISGNLSEMMVDFAKPLLQALGGPRHIDDLRQVMMLATLCWNLPVLERADAPDYHQMKRSIDETLDEMPEPVPSILRQLIEDRQTAFGGAPYYVITEVRGETLDDAVIHAEARGFES